MLKFNVEPLMYTYVLRSVCSPNPFVQINIRKTHKKYQHVH